MTHANPTDIRIARMIVRTVERTAELNAAAGRRLRRGDAADGPTMNLRLARRLVRDDAERFDITPASLASARALLTEVNAAIDTAIASL